MSSAMSKIRDEASRYDRSAANSIGLTGFLGPPMTPDVFKENLSKAFAAKFSWSEVGALMDVFDLSKDGTVNCDEFMITFMDFVKDEKRKLIDCDMSGSLPGTAASGRRGGTAKSRGGTASSSRPNTGFTSVKQTKVRMV